MMRFRLFGGSPVLAAGFLVFSITGCGDPDPSPGSGSSTQFESAPEKFPITAGIIDEASGLAPSRNMDGYLWTHQDSGQPNAVYLLSKDGASIKSFELPGTANRDWEDIATGPGPQSGVNYIYVADIGNNNSPVSATGTIYRVPEVADINGSFNQNEVRKITFSYPDGPRDAESILLDSQTRDIFIISKENQGASIYRLAFPQSEGDAMQAEKVGAVPDVALATGANVSSDGNEILVRTYLGAYYWRRKQGESIGRTLTRKADRQLSVALEPQGEAICFDNQAAGFYTLSEKGNSAGVTLNYYKRK